MTLGNDTPGDTGPSKNGCDLPKEYPFRGADDANGYRVFPDDMENDTNIFFHGTAAGNLESILKDGFQITGTLPSVSFAKTSSLALKYASEKRSDISPKGCIIAVQFDDLQRPGIKSEAFGIHVYRFDRQPHVLGYCLVPEDYKFI